MARVKKQPLQCEPWTFRGEPFVGEMAEEFAGFVYVITMPDGKKYIGKKFFSGMRKKKGAKRRAKTVSDWELYFSSSDIIKDWIKTNGADGVKREIISLHTLKRDVNFREVCEQIERGVLEELDDNGERVWLNNQINGKWWPHLVIGWRDRSQLSQQ